MSHRSHRQRSLLTLISELWPRRDGGVVGVVGWIEQGVFLAQADADLLQNTNSCEMIPNGGI